MSKMILEFDLPDEREEARLAANAGSLMCVLSELDNYLRAINKHGHEDFKDPSSCEAAQLIRDKLYELVQEYNVGELI
jgi:molecular chaperone GrpE (heat shock protein)